MRFEGLCRKRMYGPATGGRDRDRLQGPASSQSWTRFGDRGRRQSRRRETAVAAKRHQSVGTLKKPLPCPISSKNWTRPAVGLVSRDLLLADVTGNISLRLLTLAITASAHHH
jgi:hypothetical protein